MGSERAATDDPPGGHAWGLAVLAAAVLLAAQLAVLLQPMLNHGHSWLLGANGMPTLSDFAVYRVAGGFALGGDAAGAYDWQGFSERLVALTGRDQQHWLGWLNPPTFLLLMTPLALLPYTVAAHLWIALTGVAYLAAARMALPRPGTLLLALASPAVFACILKGQNGLLTAALISTGLLLLDRRPVLAGICLGAMAYKPHLGLVLPLLLLHDRRWRTIGAATGTVLGFALLSAAAFGIEPWRAFIHSAAGTADRFLVHGAGQQAMQSIYAMLEPRWGARAGMALHALAALAALLACLGCWRRDRAAEAPRAAATIAAAFLATPYVFNHDAPMLTLAALMLARGKGPLRLTWPEGAALCLAVLLPGISLFTATNLPGPLAAALTLVVARRQAGRAGRVMQAKVTASGHAA